MAGLEVVKIREYGVRERKRRRKIIYFEHARVAIDLRQGKGAERQSCIQVKIEQEQLCR